MNETSIRESVIHRRTVLRLGLGGAAGLLVPFASRPSVAEAAPAVGAYANAGIADVARSYVGRWGAAASVDAGRSGATGGQPLGDGNNADGECRAFVNAVVFLASGRTHWLGGGNGDYFWGFRNVGAAEVRLAQVARGDVGQVQTASNLHTVVVLGRNADGSLQVVDSNYGSTRQVREHPWSPPSGTRFFRCGTGGADVFFVKTRNTASGRVELHTVTPGSGYQQGASAATRFSTAEQNDGWFGALPTGDVWYVKTRNTGSGRVELHTVTPGSGYQQGISAATRFSTAEQNDGWFGALPTGDVWYVKTRNVGSGRVEVHTATAASGYRQGVSAATRFAPGEADRGWFGVVPNGDVWFIKTKATGSGRVELHTVTPGSGYQQGLSVATRFSSAEQDKGWFELDGDGSVAFVKTSSTGSGLVELHTGTPGSGYQSGISTTTRFSPADRSNGWFGRAG